MSKFAQFKKLTEAGTPPRSETSSKPLAGEEETPNNPADPDPNNQPEKENSMADETPVEQTDAYKAGVASANERMNKVFASEHFVGRESSAVKLLAKEALTADDAIELLADMPKAQPVAAVDQDEANKAAEEAGRKEMKAEMEKSGNQDLGTGDDGGLPDTNAKADSIWNTARETNEQKGL